MLPTRFYFDNALDQLFGNEGSKMMNCDIYEKDNIYHVEMDLPGFKKDEIKVECNKGNLVITAEKYLRRERSYGKYSRSFYLGDIKEDDIEAKFDNSTLTISIPKIDENENKRLIDIK